MSEETMPREKAVEDVRIMAERMAFLHYAFAKTLSEMLSAEEADHLTRMAIEEYGRLAAASVTEHLEELEKVAADSVREEGYDYPVQAKLVNMSFDDRTYGNLTMPAGEYDALRITIGKAEGQNWWCVMYPALCVPNAWSADGDRQTEQTSFDEAQQDLLEHPEQYRVKLKCVEWLEHMTARLHNVFENE